MHHSLASAVVAVLLLTGTSAPPPVAPARSPWHLDAGSTEAFLERPVEPNPAVDADGAEPVMGVDTAPDPAVADLMDWARDRFQLAGLELPDIGVDVYDTDEPCLGNAGLFQRSANGTRVSICVGDDRPEVVLHRVLLHELSHAWEDEHLSDDDRAELLKMRGLAHWDEPARWYQRGSEHVAEIMAWGLLDVDLGVVTIAPNDRASLTTAFRFITGVDPIAGLVDAGGPSSGSPLLR